MCLGLVVFSACFLLIKCWGTRVSSFCIKSSPFNARWSNSFKSFVSFLWIYNLLHYSKATSTSLSDNYLLYFGLFVRLLCCNTLTILRSPVVLLLWIDPWSITLNLPDVLIKGFIAMILAPSLDHVFLKMPQISSLLESHFLTWELFAIRIAWQWETFIFKHRKSRIL